jgi:hypothetical protein
MAGGQQGPEAIEHAAANTLSTNLNGFLDAIWAQWTDIDAASGIAVPEVYPKHVIAGRLNLINDYPTVIVTSLDGEMYGSGAPVWGETQHRIDVTALLRGDRQDILDRQSKRYLWAIWKCLMTYQMLDNSLVGNSGVTPAKYGRSLYGKGSSKQMLMAAGWEVLVHLVESV